MKISISILLLSTIGYGASVMGFWQIYLFFGAICALMTTAKRARWVSGVAAVAGSGLPLLVMTSHADVVPLAQVLGNILGLQGTGFIIVLILPSIITMLLAQCGVWVVKSIIQLTGNIRTHSNRNNGNTVN
jgi:hypothetical protein